MKAAATNPETADSPWNVSASHNAEPGGRRRAIRGQIIPANAFCRSIEQKHQDDEGRDEYRIFRFLSLD